MRGAENNGEEWHQAPPQEQTKYVEDFIACAEYLQSADTRLRQGCGQAEARAGSLLEGHLLRGGLFAAALDDVGLRT